MQALPQPISLLVFGSISVSVAASALAITGLCLDASPLLWVIPAAFIVTFTHHARVLTLARIEPHGSERLFSKLRIIWGFISALSWTLSLCATVIATVLKAMDVFPNYAMHVGIWLMTTCAVLALIESVLSWAIAIMNRKERKRITYAAKWRPLKMDRSWRFAPLISWSELR
ncbi:hypothetical protein J3R30DRAFT_1782709 [Lentinula aciculospora]|uniref:Uncharacterized protein n=1 Tax=Lentinula aciculospora TaxID=153920 RepID=A0A9W9DS33_9AGAR|nr:hypothetical protein J3R30DRAFT_1782709 [Lentinula aciculospora]